MALRSIKDKNRILSLTFLDMYYMYWRNGEISENDLHGEDEVFLGYFKFKKTLVKVLKSAILLKQYEYWLTETSKANQNSQLAWLEAKKLADEGRSILREFEEACKDPLLAKFTEKYPKIKFDKDFALLDVEPITDKQDLWDTNTYINEMKEDAKHLDEIIDTEAFNRFKAALIPIKDPDTMSKIDNAIKESVKQGDLAAQATANAIYAECKTKFYASWAMWTLLGEALIDIAQGE